MIPIALSIGKVYPAAGSVPPLAHLTPCAPTQSCLLRVLYISLATAMIERAPYTSDGRHIEAHVYFR
jgi:hypothetical protein